MAVAVSSISDGMKPQGKRRGKFGVYLAVVALFAVASSVLQMKVATKTHTAHVIKQKEEGPRKLLTFKTKRNSTRRMKNNTTKIAYVIAITQCPDGDDNGIIQDTAVLAQNIRMMSNPKHPEAKYSYKLYAFVKPDAKRCGMIAATYGWKVIWKDPPINPYDLDGNTRDQMKILHAGCCGMNEFMKLYSYTMTEYPIVVHLDIDTVFVQPLTDLFHRMLLPASSPELVSLDTMPRERKLPETVDFFFTRDYNTNATLLRGNPSKFGIQGSFFVVRPSQEMFDDMIKKLTTTEFSPTGGWDNKLYGAGEYGGVMVPGFLSYYYGEFQPERAVELHPCNYNSYATDIRYFEDANSTCRTGQATCEDCSATPIEDLKIAHFASMCHSPWKCPRYVGKVGERPLCQELHHQWHLARLDFDQTYKHVIPVKGGWGRNKTLGYCRGTGRRSYMGVPIPYALQNIHSK